MKVKSLSGVRLFGTPWTAAHQAPLPMGFSRQEYWSGLPFPSPMCVEELKSLTSRGSFRMVDLEHLVSSIWVSLQII